MIEYLDRPPCGWFVVGVGPIQPKIDGPQRWCALVVDATKLKFGPVAECWVAIPGEHETRDEAWSALRDLMATRH